MALEPWQANPYPKTDLFEIIDTVPTSHPYVIGPRHVAYAADHWSGMLSADAIRSGEKAIGLRCAARGCRLTYDQHERALLVAVHSPKKLQDLPELHTYLLSIKDRAAQEGFAGFAFIQK